MLTADSKVFELFTEIASAFRQTNGVNGISVSNCYDMLRVLINDDIVSGKMSLAEFFDVENVQVWMGYLANEYTDKQVQAFYDVLVKVDKDFDIDLVDNDSDTSDDSDYSDSDYDEDDDEDDEDDEIADVNKIMENDMKKEKWSKLMKPILNEFASESLDMLWDHFENDGNGAPDVLPKAVYTIGHALYTRSDKW